jgi:3-deoxy-manno-octulosonate cytidylyltransferase (CMP-KDO synthetase)
MVRSRVPRKILGVIPARFASTRFPGKVLAPIGAKPMLQHVYDRVCLSTYLTSVIIATDDERVYAAARKFGARVRMTRADHLSGTDRVAEVASAEEASLIVNIQGDEPLIDPAAIDAAILPMVHEPELVMGTLKKRIADAREIADPNVVKVVVDAAGDAIYFSRCPIPYERESAGGAPYFKHIGLYVYQRDFLLAYPGLRVGPLERAERLEQLRALENGYRIRVVETEYESLGVDTPEDLKRVTGLFDASFMQGIGNG